MAKDKHLERIKAIKRVSRIDTGGPHGKAGIHADKREKRVRRMGTKEWLEEAEEDMEIAEEVELAAYEAHLNREEEPIITCSMCGGQVSFETARLHGDKWIGECCWDASHESTE